jgi:hypothetical protein
MLLKLKQIHSPQGWKSTGQSGDGGSEKLNVSIGSSEKYQRSRTLLDEDDPFGVGSPSARKGS